MLPELKAGDLIVGPRDGRVHLGQRVGVQLLPEGDGRRRERHAGRHGQRQPLPAMNRRELLAQLLAAVGGVRRRRARRPRRRLDRVPQHAYARDAARVTFRDAGASFPKRSRSSTRAAAIIAAARAHRDGPAAVRAARRTSRPPPAPSRGTRSSPASARPRPTRSCARRRRTGEAEPAHRGPRDRRAPEGRLHREAARPRHGAEARRRRLLPSARTSFTSTRRACGTGRG